MEPVKKDQSGRPEGKTPAQWSRFWTAEMAAANKRMEDFLKRGNAVNRRYVDERGSSAPERKGDLFSLNLFHTNISTMKSMLYGQTPRIDVSREHKDPDDDDARVASTLLQRILEVGIRPSGEDQADVLKSCLSDRLLPGLGIARVRYKMSTTEIPSIQGASVIHWEDAPTEYVHWQDVRWGWCRTWKEMPWLAFRSYLTKDEVTKRFGDQAENNLQYKNQLPGGDEKENADFDKDKEDNVQKAEIWEIWSKKDKKVFWWSEGAHVTLDIKEDPLRLDGFWPCPKPMMANVTTSLMMPTPDFILSQDLYNQIDTLMTRIAMITKAVKVVGVYDKAAGDSVGRMLSAGKENVLIPVDNWAMFAEKGGLKGTIDYNPIETVANTLQTLRQVLGETIELLYQTTGMSDILRGANTDQYTSDGTNQLKAKFGSIRIQALQDEFARFASELCALKAEVVCKHFKPESIAEQSGAKFLQNPDLVRVGPAIGLLKSPDVKWRTEIRPESIAMIDYAQLRSERIESITAISTFLQSANSMFTALPESLPTLLEIMKWAIAGFKGADHLEGIMDQAIEKALKAPPKKEDDGKSQEGQLKLMLEQEKRKTEQMKGQMDLQKIQVKAQADLAVTQRKLEAEIAKIRTDAERDIALEDKQSMYALLEIATELDSALKEIEATTQSTLAIETAQADLDMEVDTHEHRLKMREIGAQGAGSDG